MCEKSASGGLIVHRGVKKFAAVCAIAICFAGYVYAGNSELMAYWNFDEGAGNVVYDAGGSGIDGSIEFADWTKGGKFGGALCFTGNSMVNFGNNLNPGENSFSIEFWVRQDEKREDFDSPHIFRYLARTGMVFQKYAVPYLGYGLFGTSCEDFFFNTAESTTSGGYKPVFSDLPFGKWTHLTIVVDREKGELHSYLNGKLIYSSDSLPLKGTIENEAPFILGYCYYAGVSYFARSYIDDMAFWGRALSFEEIKRHADSNQPLGVLLGLQPLSKQASLEQSADKWDYATMTYGKPWNFDDATTEGIKEFGQGLKDVNVKNGCLTFNTGNKDNWFCWGPKQIPWPPVKDKTLPVEKICANWPSWSNWYLQMKVKQSLPESTWKFYVPKKGYRKPGSMITLKGTQWQTVTAYMGEVPVAKYRSGNLIVSTEQPGNTVEIDWVKLVPAVSAHSYLRKTITLSSDPVKGDLYIREYPNFKVWVNGKLAFSRGERVKLKNYYYVNITGFLRKGKNVIALEKYSVHKGNTEGFIRCKDGSSICLLIDSSWKRSCQEEQNWTSPDFDDSGWGFACLKETSSMKQQWLNRPLLNGNRYVGPIEVTGYNCPEPIFLESEPYNLTISVPDEKGSKYTIDYMVTGFEDKQGIAQGVLTNFLQGEGVLKTELKCTIPSPGIYIVNLILKDSGEIIDTRRLETAVVGRIKQREVAWNAPIEEGLELKLIDSIDCGNEDKSREFADAPESKVVQTVVGVCRQLHPTSKSWVGYRIKVGTAHKPHLIVVEYPGNVNMTMGCEIEEKGAHSTMRVSGGCYTGYPYPLTSETKKIKFIYFPNEDVISIATVSNFNPTGKSPAQVKSIQVYEIENGLPAAKILNPQNRLLGIQSERISCSRVTFSYDTRVRGERAEPSDREGYYATWWKAIENFIRYMRFSGQNMYVCPAYMYSWPYYPSNEIPNMYEYQRDIITLFAKMFEANDMSLILNVEFFGTDRLYNQYIYTDEDVQKGAPTIFQVDRYGKQSAQNWMGPVPNYSVPEVRDEVLTLVNELAQRYKDCPSVKGIGLIVDAAGWAPGYYETWIRIRDHTNSPIDYSYDDFSIVRFQKDTGITVPGKAGDPARFGKRFQFLMSPEIQNKWVQWRCDELLSLNKEIAGTVRKTGKKYYMVEYNNVNLSRSFKENISFEEIYRQQGYDIEKYKNIPGLVLCGKFDEAGGRTNAIRGGLDKETSEYMIAYNKSEQLQKLFSGDEEFGRFVALNFWEPCLGQPKPRKKWYVKGAFLGYTWAAAPYMLDSFVSQLLYCTPAVIIHTWTDAFVPTDYADLFRRFGAAYQSIPEGKYRTLAGKGLDQNIVIRQAQVDNKTYAYLINPQWWEADCEIRLLSGTACKDLLTDKKYRTAVKMKLLPYDMRVFELSGKTAGFEAAVCTPSSEGKSFVNGKLFLCRQKLFAVESQKQTKEGEKTIRQAEELINECKQLVDDGNYYKALTLMEGIGMKKALNALPESKAGIWLTMDPLEVQETTADEQISSIESDAVKDEFSKVYRREGKSSLRWKKMRCYQKESALKEKGFTVFSKRFPVRGRFASFVYTNVKVDKAGNGKIIFGNMSSDESVVIWLNGKEVYSQAQCGKNLKEISLPVTFKKGKNGILFKLIQDKTEVNFHFKITGEKSEPIFFAVGL